MWLRRSRLLLLQRKKFLKSLVGGEEGTHLGHIRCSVGRSICSTLIGAKIYNILGTDFMVKCNKRDENMMSSALIEVVNISGIYIYVNHPIIRSHSLSLSHIVLSPQSR